MAATTMNCVTCNHFRELISARLDGELDANDETQLDAHLCTCSPCNNYEAEAWAFQRSVRLQAVRPDAAASATASNVNVAGSLQGVSLLRWALFVIGATLVILNTQAVLFTDDSVSAHLSRHDAVFGTALGIGMLAVAAKPHRAIGLVPLTSALTVLMAVVATADLVSGNASILDEAVHVVQFAGLVCLWIISGGVERFQRRTEMLGQRFGGHDAGTVQQWPIS